MNKKQKKLSVIICCIIGLIIAFPPHIKYIGKNSFNDFSFIADLPSNAALNISMLFAETAGVLIIGVILFFVFKDY